MRTIQSRERGNRALVKDALVKRIFAAPKYRAILCVLRPKNWSRTTLVLEHNYRLQGKSQRHWNEDIKVIFERSSQKGGRQGVRKEGRQGTHLEILIVGLKHRKNSIWENRIFIVVAFSQEMTVTIILNNYPPSTLQGVGLRGRKNPRIIVGENYCHFGASY